jgi:glycosyltransferase involved in cell wall biosynthesis
VTLAVGASRVTVALCTRNGERFIAEQVQSILAQTLLPDEIVLSDDASTDNTVAVVVETVEWHRSEHGHSTPRLTVIENERPLGVTSNFEQAILAAADGLVALCDQDDIWERDRLAHAAELFAGREDLMLVHSDALLIDGMGEPVGGTLLDALGVSAAARESIHDGQAFGLLMKRNVVTGATTMIRRELAQLASPFADGWLHDEWLAIVAAALGGVDVIDESLVRYRQHGGNEIGARRLSTLGRFRRMLEPGAERNRRLLARASSLVQRFADLAVPPVMLADAEQKLRHEQARSSLGAHRLGRVAPVLREARTGRYARFGRGWADAVRDVIQPLKPLG